MKTYDLYLRFLFHYSAAQFILIDGYYSVKRTENMNCSQWISLKLSWCWVYSLKTLLMAEYLFWKSNSQKTANFLSATKKCCCLIAFSKPSEWDCCISTETTWIFSQISWKISQSICQMAGWEFQLFKTRKRLFLFT